MRVFIFLLFLLTVIPLKIATAGNTAQTPPHSHESTVYICPMHPHIIGEKGDNCPICGMHLVPANEEPSDYDEEHGWKKEGGLNIRSSYIQMLGVKTDSVAHHEFGRNIRAFGKIAASTRLETVIDMRAKGWIVDLGVNAIGDEVKKGDLIFTYHSPDLMVVQSDFLKGPQTSTAEQRLRLYGMGDRAIEELRKRGRFFEATPFYASVEGTVTALNVRKGGYVGEGDNVLRLQSFSKVWVLVDVPIRDVSFLKVGTPAEVIISETGKKYGTEVDFIYPVSNPQTRTVEVRLLLDNQDGVFKPETYADVVFQADVQRRLAVPEQAVLYGKAGAYIMEDMGAGNFRPVMVETGITAGGITEIKKGLSHGQKIVTSGQFMIDAESNLRGGMSSMQHDGDSARGGQEHVH